jgi:threonine/homoserine/homoserine lactone efflux protein
VRSVIGSFVLVAGVVTLTPGMDTAIILRTAVTGRLRRLRAVLRRPLVSRMIDGIAGTVVTAFGARLALSRP